MGSTEKLVKNYLEEWKQKGYPKDIPDQAPGNLVKMGLAPSYKAICLAILNNDLSLKSLSGVNNWRESIIKLKGFTKNNQKEFL